MLFILLKEDMAATAEAAKSFKYLWRMNSAMISPKEVEATT